MNLGKTIVPLITWFIACAVAVPRAEAGPLDSYTAQTRQQTEVWNTKIATLIAKHRVVSAIAAIDQDRSCRIPNLEPPREESSAAANWARRNLSAALNCRSSDRRWQHRLSNALDSYQALAIQTGTAPDTRLTELASSIIDRLRDHSRTFRPIVDRLNGKVIQCAYTGEYGTVNQTTRRVLRELRQAVNANDAYLARSYYNEIVTNGIDRYVDAESCGSSQADEVAQVWIDAAESAKGIAGEKSVDELIAEACKSLPDNLVPAEACSGARPTVEMEYAVHSALKLVQNSLPK